MSKRDRRVAARTKAAAPPGGSRTSLSPAAPRNRAAGRGQAERGRAAGEGHPDADLRPVRRGGQALVTRAASPGPAGDPAGEREHLQLTTLAGWREFVTEMPAVPDLLPEAAWKALDDGARLGYDDARIAHHARLLTVANLRRSSR